MKSMIRLAGILAALTVAVPAAAQTGTGLDNGRLHATRADLEAALAYYQQNGQADEASLIQARLSNGDFRVGDQINLSVTGQQPLTGDFLVTDGPQLELPEVGTISLAGLLRSELKDALTQQISQYVRDPQVIVTTHIRLAIFGEIGSPGYHIVPSDGLLTDVIMQAGGPGGDADQEDIKIKRGDETIWEGEELQAAMVEGRTIDQLNLRAGDEIEVPGGGSSVWTIVRGAAALSSAVFLITRIANLFD